ncbi:FtsX-like permease family protein [Bifidobacterium sp. ESL0732]|uniref:ABC transporter permease n=1 Tax=Bifidobacterium sp. ESL0732 TaxID=2983222 RepID=UPI0023F8398E|nr:FtsX-like permease family protein [Bifidobacterium sp. ESL0732]WEV64121.1 FtsX-like permease family protein [Bifidobacterium sp. ESL0732]
MTNRQMFFRMLFSAVFRRRSRALMAVVASLVGAATLFCLAAICVAVPQQMNEEMRAYGANLIITPTQRTVAGKAVDGSKTANVADYGFNQKTVTALNETVKDAGSERSASYRYENTRINSLPFVVAGIDPHDVKALNHHWSVEGKWPSNGGVMLGRDAATKLDAKIGSVITIKYSPGKSVATTTGGSAESGQSSGSTGGNSSGHDMSNMKGMKMSATGSGSVNLAEWKSPEKTSAENADNRSGSVHLAEWKPTAPNAGGMEFRVDGIVDTGGSEDDMVYANNLDVDKLTGFERGADVVEFSVDTSDAGLSSLVGSVNKTASLNAKAQKVTKITSSNVHIITMLQTLFWIVTVVVLVLTLVGVGTTISSIVSQRRNEIGLRKALGASSRNIAVEFTVEAALYGLIGGLFGTAIGYVLARALSASVFGQKLSLNWPLALASVLVSMLVAVLASLPPVRNAVRIDPAVVLQEE